MALDNEFWALSPTDAVTRHDEMIAFIEQTHLINQFVLVGTVIAVYALIYIAVDNWTCYRVEDDFERIEPPVIDWDKVDL